ncbi:MAG: hypothetical protein N2320_06765, partial [Candidatus Bipolaricaulota bacterium]|nr:hypothetical protein [Candidatus Bipolaricaulota bacterium]
FDYIVLNGRLTLYARKDATDQLRRIHGVSVRIASREFIEPLGLYVVVARATTADGREDEAIGAVSVRGLSGDALANAIMKAETKAKAPQVKDRGAKEVKEVKAKVPGKEVPPDARLLSLAVWAAGQAGVTRLPGRPGRKGQKPSIRGDCTLAPLGRLGLLLGRLLLGLGLDHLLGLLLGLGLGGHLGLGL